MATDAAPKQTSGRDVSREGTFLEKGAADIFQQRGSDWEGLRKTVSSCCHRHLRNHSVFPTIIY